jgi:hypothetical protein
MRRLEIRHSFHGKHADDMASMVKTARLEKPLPSIRKLIRRVLSDIATESGSAISRQAKSCRLMTGAFYSQFDATFYGLNGTHGAIAPFLSRDIA